MGRRVLEEYGADVCCEFGCANCLEDICVCVETAVVCGRGGEGEEWEEGVSITVSVPEIEITGRDRGRIRRDHDLNENCSLKQASHLSVGAQ